jgi:hypothetical protein
MNRYLPSSLVNNFQDAFQWSAIVGFFPALVFPELMQWYTINYSYVNIALAIIAIDHILGTITHSRMYKDDFDWRKNITGFGVKVSMVVVFGFIMEGLAHITIEDDFIYRYIKMSGRILVILYPAISAMKNMKIITKGVFPPDAIVGKLENFNKDLDIEKLKRGNDEQS